MCVIVHQPAGSYLSKKSAKEMWDRNSDGGGFAYINDDNEIVIDKAMNFGSFWSKFESHRSANRDKDFLVHMRIATSGKIGLDNTHPFVLDDHTVMAHNGVLNHIVGPIGRQAEKSDTREFMDFILPELPEDWLDNPVLVDMVEDYIGSSKLMFLTTNPALRHNVYILNKNLGTDRHNMWWSNTAHVPFKHKNKKNNVTNRGGNYRTKSHQVVEKIDETSERVITHYNDGSQSSYTRKREIDTTKPSEDQLHNKKVPAQDEADVRAFWERHAADLEEADQRAKEHRMKLRRENGLGDIDIYIDPKDDMWKCKGCHSVIGMFTADCACWDMICVACGSMAPYCVHGPEEGEWIPVKQAPEYYEALNNPEKEVEDAEIIPF